MLTNDDGKPKIVSNPRLTSSPEKIDGLAGDTEDRTTEGCIGIYSSQTANQSECLGISINRVAKDQRFLEATVAELLVRKHL